MSVIERANRKKHLQNLTSVLCTIAKRLNLDNPELQAKIIRNRLLGRIDDYRSNIPRQAQYGRFVEPWKREQTRPDAFLRYVVRLTDNKRTIGRRRGLKPVDNPASVIEEAASIESTTQLTPVQQRAFAILKGVRRRSRSHPIEKRAAHLAEAVEDEWLNSPRPRGRPRGKWTRQPENTEEPSFKDLKPPLTLTQLIEIAAPVIEEFAQCRIAKADATFGALYHIICAYSDLIARNTASRDLRISRKAIQEALSRVRQARRK
jgi:hypothetical protein